MGRDEKRAKQARRDRRRRDFDRPGMTLHAVSTPEQAEAALFGPGPASDDWRQDVLGRQALSVRLGRDGNLTINGHLLTREMCAELQAERPDEPAADFEYDTFMDMRREMIPGLEMRRPAP
ncbi:hypothetical protein AB0J05_49740 [Streptomyces phaeochromogenes]|uniref:hypothetical protein n=1 Tax=Streptomyces TaxID=1883 RepID=UPI0033DF5097